MWSCVILFPFWHGTTGYIFKGKEKKCHELNFLIGCLKFCHIFLAFLLSAE